MGMVSKHYNNPVNRRTFVAAAAAGIGVAQQAPVPVIDTHIHLFDPTRPEGVPWPPKTASFYQKTLPDRLRTVTKGLNVVGAIEVECSPLLEDNQWVLDVAAKDPIIVGTVGNLDPGSPKFDEQLERFGKNPLFRGIRFGYLWGRNLGEELQKPKFFSGLKRMADGGYTLDTANAAVRTLRDVVLITDKVPKLRIVIDHLAGLIVKTDSSEYPEYVRLMQELGKRPQVYVKVSDVLKKRGKTVDHRLSPYRAKLDELWNTFGADRLLYGSDWPNSVPLGTYPQVFSVVREYFKGKGREAEEKYFWKNSVAAYKWVKRSGNQPG
jgi:predicted TIM-barrel fold metal-dependent hydrolase